MEHTSTELRTLCGRCTDGAQVRRLLALALVLDGHSRGEAAALRELVIRGPDLERDKVVRWRCVDLQAEVARRFSVEVHENTIGRWLHELGLTRLQPRPFNPQKDPEAETIFKKTSPAWSNRRSPAVRPPAP